MGPMSGVPDGPTLPAEQTATRDGEAPAFENTGKTENATVTGKGTDSGAVRGGLITSVVTACRCDRAPSRDRLRKDSHQSL